MTKRAQCDRCRPTLRTALMDRMCFPRAAPFCGLPASLPVASFPRLAARACSGPESGGLYADGTNRWRLWRRRGGILDTR